jgi:hypothetical protein
MKAGKIKLFESPLATADAACTDGYRGVIVKFL